MPQHAVVKLGELDKGLILVPERYDPRRFELKGKGVPLLDFVDIVRHQVLPGTGEQNTGFLVLDTGDVREGIVFVNKDLCTISEIGSAKKAMQPGDVIISRLRPYLRQVGLIDEGLYSYFSESFRIVGSTEFFVLRPRHSESIAFLVSFLLRTDIQIIFASSQEGGHHPRFTQQTLENLYIPNDIFDKRNAISCSIEAAILKIRKGDIALKHQLSLLATGI